MAGGSVVQRSVQAEEEGLPPVDREVEKAIYDLIQRYPGTGTGALR